MYGLNASRILYQTSKYAPVGVLQLDVSVPEDGGSREQIIAALERIGSGISPSLLPPSGEPSAINIYVDLVLGLQNSVGHSVQYCRVQESDVTHEYRVFVEYEEDTSALYAAEAACQLLNDILAHEDHSKLQQLFKEFEVYARPRTLDSNARLLIRAARRRDIPVLRPVLPGTLYASAEELQNGEFQLGWGVHQQRCNGAISKKLCPLSTLAQVLDRAKLYPQLIHASIPMPGQDLEFLNRNQARRAQRSARRIGFPVILRPRAIRLFQYRFPEDYVFGPLHNDDQVAMVARYLSENNGLDVWVESHVSGEHYRFLVMNGEVLSVVRCTPPLIIGDGVQTIAELTGQTDDADVLFRLQLDRFSMNSVLPSGLQLPLRGSGSLQSGGSCEDVTGNMPSKFNELAIKVSEQSGLRVMAGIDLVIDELSGSASAPNCVVSNVVPDPDLRMFAQLSDQPDRIGDEYLARLFPDGAASRIPIISVTGTNGKTTTSRMVAQILRNAGLKTGLTCSDGVYLDDKLLKTGDSSGVAGAIELLVRPDVEAVVLETARGGLANTGIVYDHCDVGACLNIANEHLGFEGIETLNEMAVHKRQVIERTTGAAVLNADDPRCLAMRDYTSAKEVILVGSSAGHTVIKAHCEAGGKAIAVDDSGDRPVIVLLTAGNETTPLMAVGDIPVSFDGKAQYNVMNAMSAIAMSLGLGIERSHIVSTLTAFRMGADSTPGRLNEFTGFPFRLILDVAHNPHGFRALVEFTNQLSVPGNKIINFGASGARPDDNIREITREVAGNFDLYIVKNFRIEKHLNLMERRYEEVPELIKEELIRQGVPGEKIIVELDVLNSLDRSLKTAQKGDLLVVVSKAAGNDKFEMIKYLEAAAIEADRG